MSKLALKASSSLPSTEEIPSIYLFEDFRDFLRARLDWLKSYSPSFSLRSFSKACGFSGKSFLQFILSGKRNISSTSTIKIAKGLQLTRQETAYFFALVNFNQEIESEKKTKLLKKVMELRNYSPAHSISQDSLEYVSHWYIPAIRELANLDRFQANPKWIAENLFPSISEDEASKALQVLERLQFIKKLPNGAVRPCEPTVDIAEEMNAQPIYSFFLQSIEVSKAALMNLPSEKREFGHMTLTLDEKLFSELKTELTEFRLKVFSKYGSARVSDNSVYQLNLQFFPVSRKV